VVTTSRVRRRVSMIMPVYNEARYLPKVLASIAAQEFDRERMFLFIVDGNSRDGSAEIAEAWFANGHIAGCVLSNPRRKIAIALNLALREVSEDDIILRLDAHTLYGPTYVADAVRALGNAAGDVACIGGAQLPVPGATFEERIVEALYTNPFGLGGADFRLGHDIREADSVYLGAWRPGVLVRAGGFNETMEANEDGELAARIRKMGYRILRVPLPCRFLIKRGVWASIRQWNRYGFWRAKMLQRQPQFIRIRHVVSPAGVLATLALLLSPWRLWLLPAFCAYALLVFRGRAKDEPLLVTLASLAFFPALQFAWGAGVLAGIVTGPGSAWPPPPLASRRVSAQIRS
jgi:succinoglycan biosynthesis protein ExoA